MERGKLVNKFRDINTIPKAHRQKYREQIGQLEKTRNDLPKVRRLLANIPTYMIFDDHEITDDWNITREWYENVRASKCGKQAIANGLAAYWVFQGWGNNPALYDYDFISKTIEYLGKNGNVSEAEKISYEENLWNFHSWTFCAPTNPTAIVVDCRTLRYYDSFNGPHILLHLYLL
jgi:hypothetical protein